MKLYLIRGPSGTGKSTIAIHLAWKNGCFYHPSAFETDQFFNRDGQYKFNISKLKTAHQWNQLCVEREMFHSVPTVICSNTFIAHWEMEHYLELAEEYKYEVEIIRSPRPWDADVLFLRNKHNVPLDVVHRHINGYQPHPKEIEWTDLSIFQKEDGHA